MPDLKNLIYAAVDGQILEIPMLEIHIDYSWNMRTGNWQADLDEMQASMLPDGPEGRILQDQPVVVRPYERAIGSWPLAIGQKEESQQPTANSQWVYSLVSGFSRCTCLQRIAELKGDPNPKVWALIRVLDEWEALTMNIRENVGRNQVKQADVAVQLWRAWQCKGMEKGLWDEPYELAPQVAMSVNNVKQILEIMRKGSSDLIKVWQNTRIEANLFDLLELVRKYPKPEQKRAFSYLVMGYERRNHKHAGVQTKAGRTARDVGLMLGCLENEGHIVIKNRNFGEYLHLLVRTSVRGQKLRKWQLEKLVTDGYQEAIGYQSSAVGGQEPQEAIGCRPSAVGEQELESPFPELDVDGSEAVGCEPLAVGQQELDDSDGEFEVTSN
jgi:hypothetical protein